MRQTEIDCSSHPSSGIRVYPDTASPSHTEFTVPGGMELDGQFSTIRPVEQVLSPDVLYRRMFSSQKFRSRHTEISDMDWVSPGGFNRETWERLDEIRHFHLHLIPEVRITFDQLQHIHAELNNVQREAFRLQLLSCKPEVYVTSHGAAVFEIGDMQILRITDQGLEFNPILKDKSDIQDTAWIWRDGFRANFQKPPFALEMVISTYRPDQFDSASLLSWLTGSKTGGKCSFKSLDFIAGLEFSSDRYSDIEKQLSKVLSATKSSEAVKTILNPYLYLAVQ